MPPRRSHKKSRAGCRRCKARKIKCDEVHPRCGNCTKHGVACDFEHPGITDVLSPAETPRPTTSASSGDSPSTSTLPPTPSVDSSTPLPIYRNPEPLPLTSNTKSSRMMELKLLHHYTTITCETLAISSPVSERIWRDTVPNLAFTGAHFLADALLAVSALHLRYNAPQDQELVRASHAYMASTLSEYSASLSKGINESNAEALFLTASLIAFQSTASRIFTRDDGGDVKDRSDGYVLPLSWFHSFQGVKAVVASSWQWLRNSGIVIPIIESQPALNLDLSGQNATFFGHLMNGVEEEIAALDDNPEGQILTRQAYQHAVAVLDWAHKIPHTGAPLVFLATVSRRFVELLEARRPRALAILASYFGLLKCLDGVWWLKGVARREVMGIVSLFDPDDEEWWSRLQWPIRIALYEGDVIPPDVWGADWVAETALLHQGSQNGSFVSHIELLSQMFSTMQSMPPPNLASAMPDVMDVIAHQNALVRSRTFERHPFLDDHTHDPF
ncbi:uncharacterized protein F4822DRAFT_411085 [Hypoxylon trugodes]|uniref:uncharacterized protein n=1 Tax=Hypoxylon trugodes TaxID=326681 RepID=UPI00219E577A|nr:uncharacterized protein F4822DRAFT_411085 [Hypoxylon trugodes]KAI1386741.1 hypothetical protein F4822DRAFT_411085 [Hypoxylon trugodes]